MESQLWKDSAVDRPCLWLLLFIFRFYWIRHFVNETLDCIGRCYSVWYMTYVRHCALQNTSQYVSCIVRECPPTHALITHSCSPNRSLAHKRFFHHRGWVLHIGDAFATRLWTTAWPWYAENLENARGPAQQLLLDRFPQMFRPGYLPLMLVLYILSQVMKNNQSDKQTSATKPLQDRYGSLELLLI